MAFTGIDRSNAFGSTVTYLAAYRRLENAD